jgi:hypothetical protein
MHAVDPVRNMLAALQTTAGQGTYEAHVTVSLGRAEHPDAFRALCSRLGVKCVVIELPHGQVQTQPMTSSYHRGSVQQAAREVANLAGALREAGFAVNRVKMEAVTTNSGVPQSDEEARAMPASNYFEFHVKALLPAEVDVEQLRALCERHDAHLSRNALKKDTDGRQERFLTQRAYGVGRVNAEARFERLLSALEEAGHALGTRLREYSIFDSNARVDAGWIDPPDGEDHT